MSSNHTCWIHWQFCRLQNQSWLNTFFQHLGLFKNLVEISVARRDSRFVLLQNLGFLRISIEITTAHNGSNKLVHLQNPSYLEISMEVRTHETMLIRFRRCKFVRKVQRCKIYWKETYQTPLYQINPNCIHVEIHESFLRLTLVICTILKSGPMFIHCHLTHIW
jgi:hypothetical protein